MGKKKKGPKHLRAKKIPPSIIRFSIYLFVLIVVGSVIHFLNSFNVKDLYKAFIFSRLSLFMLFVIFLSLSSFFLYLFFVIVVRNPQQIKAASLVKYAASGVITFIITIVVLGYGVIETKKSIVDFKNYNEGYWQVEDLVVTELFRATNRPRTVYLKTAEGELTLHWEKFTVFEGETYRFTFLKETKTIIAVEKTPF